MDDQEIDDNKAGVLALIGSVAQSKATGQDYWEFLQREIGITDGGIDGDLDQLASILNVTTRPITRGDLEPELSRWHAEACRILDAYWTDVERLAEALLESHRLSYELCLGLVKWAISAR